jgi:hypothetical protein
MAAILGGNMKDQTCKELVQGSFERKLETIRVFLDPKPSDAEAVSDDKKWLLIGDVEIDIEDLGIDLDNCLDDDGDLNPCEIAHQSMLSNNNIREELRDQFCNYALSFDYVTPDTFDGQKRGYFRYQISWGGPTEEFRFYVDENLQATEIEYWYLDWFDGASIECTNDATVQMLFEEFQDSLEYVKEAA